jgi:hypothetical protein
MSQRIDADNKYDLNEYGHSKQVVKDLPKILFILDNIIKLLDNYRHYLGAAAVLESAYDARTLLQLQLVYYEKIYKDKGKVINE